MCVCISTPFSPSHQRAVHIMRLANNEHDLAACDRMCRDFIGKTFLDNKILLANCHYQILLSAFYVPSTFIH